MHFIFLKTARHRVVQAFSLIEIVLAIGIVSFALVGILGLFPVALQSATNSQQETQAAVIARAIFSDLAAQEGKTRHLLYGEKNLSKGGYSNGGNDNRSKLDVHLDVEEKNYLSYRVTPDGDGLIQNASTSGEYDGGSPTATYLAEVSNTQIGLPDGLTQVTVTVSTPAAVRKSSRTTYLFATLFCNGIVTPPAP